MTQLDVLKGERFLLAISAIATARGLVDFFDNCREVVNVRSALGSGALTSTQVEAFVRELLEDFRPGQKFYGDAILAAIAVAVSSAPGAAYDRFLEQLSGLGIREISLAPHVASIMKQRRANVLAGSTARSFMYTRQRRDRVYPAGQLAMILVRSATSAIEEPFEAGNGTARVRRVAYSSEGSTETARAF